MKVLLDTSAFFAVMDADDADHTRAAGAWRGLMEQDDEATTTSYVLVETVALLQRRLGLAAVQAFHSDVAPLVTTVWVDEALHATAVGALLLSGRRRVSLVDCVSFEVMRRRGIRRAFALDRHFREQGFDLIP